MENQDTGVYQVEYDKNFKEKQSHRFDIAIRSGIRGQSYLSWVKNGLIHLPFPILRLQMHGLTALVSHTISPFLQELF